jgi:hypothetical protein
MDEMVQRMERVTNDMYFGDARKPGLMTRAEQLEGRMDEVERDQDATGRKFNAILGLLITILGGLITEMVRR